MSSSVSAASGSNMEMVALAMTKRSTQADGQAAMSLLEGAVSSAQQVQKSGTVQSSGVSQATGSLGANVDIHV